jgi:TrmH family RNA methyltransferase
MGAFASKTPINRGVLSFLEEKPINVPLYLTNFEGESPKKLAGITSGVVVLGSESHGVSEIWENSENTKITIPSSPNSKAESLNVAIAASIVCFQIKQG